MPIWFDRDSLDLDCKEDWPTITSNAALCTCLTLRSNPLASFDLDLLVRQPQTDCVRMSGACIAVQQMIDSEIAAGIPANRIALIGFSQGTPHLRSLALRIDRLTD